MDPIKKLYERLQEGAIDKCYAWYKPGRHFRCSESADCVRKLWHRLYGHRPAPRGPVMEVYGICGDLDHDLTRQLFEYADVPIHTVTTLETGAQIEKLLLDQTFQVEHNGETYDVRIRGRSDGEIDTDKGRVLLEIKGTGFYPYKFLQKAYDKSGLKGLLDRVRGVQDDNSDAKHLQWYAQCQVSMGLTGHEYTYLVVKDRSTGTLGFYKENDQGRPDEATRTGVHLPFDQAFFEKTLQRFAYVLRKLDEGVPPAPEFTKGSKPCSQCDFYYRCHGDGVYPGPQIDMEPINEETNRVETVDNGGVVPGLSGDGTIRETTDTKLVEEADPNARYSE